MSFKEKQLKNIKKKNLKQWIIKHANKKDWWEAPDELQKNFTEKQLKEIKKKELKKRKIKHANKKDGWEALDELQKTLK